MLVSNDIRERGKRETREDGAKEKRWTAFTALPFSEGHYKREGASEREFSSIPWKGKVRLSLTDVYWRRK